MPDATSSDRGSGDEPAQEMSDWEKESKPKLLVALLQPIVLQLLRNQKKKRKRRKVSLVEKNNKLKLCGEISPLFFNLFLICNFLSFLSAQDHQKNLETYTPLKKKVYSFSKIDFITSEGEFNESICTISIPDFKKKTALLMWPFTTKR